MNINNENHNRSKQTVNSNTIYNSAKTPGLLITNKLLQYQHRMHHQLINLQVSTFWCCTLV